MEGKYKMVADYNVWVTEDGNENKDIWAIHDEHGNFLFDVLGEDYETMLDMGLVEDGYMLAPHTEQELLDCQAKWGILWTDKM